MTGGDAGGPHRQGPPETNTEDAVADTAADPNTSAPPMPDAPTDAEPGTDDVTPPSGIPAIDDPAGLPPIVQATTPPGAPAAAAPPPVTRPSVTAPTPPAAAPSDAHEPGLPRDQGVTHAATATVTAARSAPSVPSGAVYRSTEERNRSVYRRANPWYRRLARGVIAATLIAALAGGVYWGALQVQDYLDRDRLPSAGAEVPTIRETSFLVESTASGVELDGTLSVDVDTGAFEFVGTPNGPNAADRLTSPGGTTVYAQGTGSTWIELSGNEPVVVSVRRAIDILSSQTTSDAILTDRIRRGYVDLTRQIEEGTGNATRTRYDITLDLTSFAESFPLQWQAYQSDAIPGIRESRRHPLSFWLDDEEVLVQVVDEASGWSWQRLTYSASAFEPFAPAPGQIDQQAAVPAAAGTIPCTVDQLGVVYATTLPTCEDADDVGRGLAVTTGLADNIDDPAAQLAFLSVCQTLQGDTVTEFESDAYLDLAELLVDTGVCPGDLGLAQRAG